MNHNATRATTRIIAVARHWRARGSGTQPGYEPEQHAGQRATIFVTPTLVVLCGVLGLVVCGMLLVALWMRGFGEEVTSGAIKPSNKLDKPVTAVAVDTFSAGGTRLLATDYATLHVGKLIKDLHYWQRQPVAQLAPYLAAPTIVGMAPDHDRIVFLSEKNGRRGLAAFTLPDNIRKMTPWARPILDTSFFPGANDENVSSIAFDPATGDRFIGAAGVGIYNVAERRWKLAITRESKGIEASHVNDLALLPDNRLAIMGDAGITIGQWQGKVWEKPVHFRLASGLVSDHVKLGQFYPSGSDKSATSSGDLVYLTADRGLGELRLNSIGTEASLSTFIGEGRAHALTRPNLLRAAETREHSNLWMVYKSAEATEKYLAASYQVGTHHMRGLPTTEAWIGSPDLTLAVDDHVTAPPTAWVGEQGVHRLTADGHTTLAKARVGLTDQKIGEIVPTPQVIFAKTSPVEQTTPPTVFAAKRSDLGPSKAGKWDTYIGPRRFPNLKLDDITAAADGQWASGADQHAALYVGTTNQGIGVFDRHSRELFRVFEKEQNDGSVAAGTLDLAAAGPMLAQVGSDRSLNVFDSKSWHTLIPSGGTTIKPNEVRTVVASGPDLVIGSSQQIGHYSAMTHQWQALPPLPNLERLVLAAGHLWGIDRNRLLHVYPLLNQAGAQWRVDDQDERVVDVYGDEHMMAVIAERAGATRLWVRTLAAADKQVLVEATALPGQASAWTAAAVQDAQLYLAPHAQGIARYDLTTHQWQKLPAPSNVIGAVRQLVVTSAGLWLLSEQGVLSFLPHGDAQWQTAAESVYRLGFDNANVIALKREGQVLVSQNGQFPMQMLVGDSLPEAVEQLKAGIVFNDALFLAMPGQVVRYEADKHHWSNVSPAAGRTVQQFAPSAKHLYARLDNGHVFRWPGGAQDKPSWQPVMKDGNRPLEAEEISGHGGPIVAVWERDGRVTVLSDEQPDKPVTILAASRFEFTQAPTAAAEIGRDLMLATADGVVATYAKAKDAPWQWSAIVGSDKALGPVRELLVPPKRSDRVVAIGDKNWLLRKAGPESAWTSGRQLLTDVGPVDGAVSSKHFYGLVQKPSESSLLVRTALDSDQPDHHKEVVIGAHFPGREATVAVGSTSGAKRELFRADSAGTVAAYDFQSHHWDKDPSLQNVQRFLPLGEQLWVWSRQTGQTGTLATRSNGAWQVDPQRWRQVTSDGDAMLMVNDRGALVLRTGSGDRVLIPALAQPLPLKSLDDVIALAEQREVLFLALRGGPLLAYQRDKHAWEIKTDLTEVVQFEAIGKQDRTLFARTAAGRLLRYNPSQQQWGAIRDKGDKGPETVFTSLVSSGEQLIAVTKAGHILFMNQEGEVVTAYRPQLLSGQVPFDLVAAAEVAGRLVLAPRPSSVENYLWVYDPEAHTWSVYKLEGQALSFLHADGATWLALRDKENMVKLVRIDSPPKPGLALGPFLDAAADGMLLLVVTPNGGVSQIKGDGTITAVPVANAALPEGRSVHIPNSVADDCVVLLNDGSLYHYNTSKRQWVEKVPPLQRSELKPGYFKRQRGTPSLLLIRGNGEMWQVDPASGNWNLVPEDVDEIPSPPSDQKTSACKVVRRSPPYAFSLQQGAASLELTLEGSRFNLDRVEALALRSGTLWLKTPAGVRQYQQQQDGWREQTQGVGQFPQDKPDPLAFEGQVFAARREAQGAFKAAGTPVTLTMKLGTAQVVLQPAQGEAGTGFAHDIVRHVAPDKDGALLATAAGAVRLEVRGGAVRMTRIDGKDQGLSDVDLVRILAERDRFLVQTRQGGYSQRSSTQSPWTTIGVEDGKKAFDAVASLTRYNSMLQRWQVAGQRLQFVLDQARQVPVSLSAAGFGFDHPQALALAPRAIRLYTPDGLVELPRTETSAPPSAFDPTYALPATMSGYPDLLEVFRDNRLVEVWLNAPEKTWRFTGNAWNPATVDDYAGVLRSQQPFYWNKHGIQWGRDDRVQVALQAGSIFAQYDLALGRFDVDMPSNLAVYQDELWTVTRGGLVRYNDDRMWQGVLLSDKAQTFGTRPRLLVIPQGEQSRLFFVAENLFLEWRGNQWQPPANQADIVAALSRRDAHLVSGNTWQIARADVQAAPYKMRARLIAGQEFADVQLLREGRFDFEQVKALETSGQECHIASLFGLARIDTRTRDFVALTKQLEAVARLGSLQGRLYAKLTSGKELEYTKNQWQPSTVGDVFATIDEWLINTSPWRWRRVGGKVNVQLESTPNGIWQGTGVRDVPIVNKRFHFDAVLDVGHADVPWLATEAGLLARNGKQVIASVQGDVSRDRGDERLLFAVVPDQERRLYARMQNGLHVLEGRGWQLLQDAQRRNDVEQLAQTQVAKNQSYWVQRETNRLKLQIHIPSDPPGVYRQVDFDDRQGKFTFDIPKKDTRKAPPDDQIILVATAGGVVAYPLQDVSRWRLYADRERDGVDRIPIRDIVFAKRDKANLLITDTDELLRLEQDKWRSGTASDRDVLERVQKMIADDPDAWQIRDQPGGAGHFEMKWRTGTVRLLDLRQTNDTSESITRFAHDVPLSAVLTEKGLWVGTRGGAVFFDASTDRIIKGSRFELYADQTLGPNALHGADPPKGIGFIRSDPAGGALYIRREGDGMVLRYANSTWQNVLPEDAGFQKARIVAQDSLWRWTKDSLAPVRMIPEDTLQVPNNYTYLSNGTWAFLETGQATQRDPRHTAVFFRGHLYVATVGGIARFPLPTAAGASAEVRWPDDRHNFIDTVYGLARDGATLVPMPDIVELFVDRREQLYGRSRTGRHYVFQPDRNLWLVHQGGSDPMVGATEVVDNALFKWRMTNTGGFDITVLPLLQDMPDQSTYRLFSNGRFAFDEVYAFLRDGDRLWLATDGGICLYAYEGFKAERFLARAFMEAETKRGTTSGGLPQVREIVRDPEQPARIITRTTSGSVLETDRTTLAFVPSKGNQKDTMPPDDVFTRAYTRERLQAPHYSMRLVQYPFGSASYPDGALKAFVATASGPTVSLGAKATGAALPLFSNNRFSFDDVRAVVLHNSSLLAATPVGVVEHVIDWSKQQAALDRLHSFAESPQAPSPRLMEGLERMVRFSNGSVITWSNSNVFDAMFAGDSNGSLSWKVNPTLQAEKIGPEMLLIDQHESWHLRAYQSDKHSAVVTRMMNDKSTASREVHSRFKPLDVSVAVMDDDWIYLPDPRGGLFRVRKSGVQ